MWRNYLKNDLEIDIYYLTKNVKKLDELYEEDTLKSIFKNKNDFILFANNLKISGGIYKDFYGSISIKLKDKQIIKKEYYDDIYLVIVYFLNSIEEYINSSYSEFYYPESPINIKFQSKRDYLEFTFDKSSYKIIDEKLFFDIFLDKLRKFFEILVYDLNLTSYLVEINKIDKIQKSR